MFEALIGLALVLLFCLIGWSLLLGPEALIWAGIALATLGFAYGIPTAIVYHWRLYRSLLRAGRLPTRWWLQPTAHHALLPPEDRGGVLFWGIVGGTGFGVIVLGILITSVGLWRTLRP